MDDSESGGCERKLTITPSYESSFRRGEFVDILRALGPAVEDVLCGAGGQEQARVVVEVCLVDKEAKRDWWRAEARTCFPRSSARGRLEFSFEKGECRLVASFSAGYLLIAHQTFILTDTFAAQRSGRRRTGKTTRKAMSSPPLPWSQRLSRMILETHLGKTRLMKPSGRRYTEGRMPLLCPLLPGHLEANTYVHSRFVSNSLCRPWYTQNEWLTLI